MVTKLSVLLAVLSVAICATSQVDAECVLQASWDNVTYGLLDKPMTFNMARKACNRWNGYLAVGPVVDPRILRFVLRSFKFVHWDYPSLMLGVSDFRSEGTFRFQTPPGEPNTDDFDEGILVGNTAMADCATLQTWNQDIKMEKCGDLKMALCQKHYYDVPDSIANDTCLPPVESCDIMDRYAKFDGSCNSLLDIYRGIRGRPLKRLIPAAYRNGRDSPRDFRRLPSPRAVTNAIRDLNSPNSTIANNHLVIWGQLLAHDLARSAMGSLVCNCTLDDPECYNIKIPRTDPMREEFECMHFTRSKGIANANCNYRVREQENLETSYIDASFVYGSTDAHAAALRAPASQPGKLLAGNVTTPDTESLPLEDALVGSDQKMDCPAIHKPVGTSCFAAGDVRAGEQPSLAVDHLTFFRYHNQIVDGLQALNPMWDSDKLYQTTRQIMAAITQHINYNEFLHPVLGDYWMKRFGLFPTKENYYYGYNANYDASISNGFTTVAFRFGHTMVVDTPTLQSAHYNKLGDAPLEDHYFGTELFYEYDGAGQMLRGALVDEASKFDANLVTALTDKLFVASGFKFGRDLNALNIQRGRDHGIPSYFEYRKFCGLSEDLSDMPKKARKKLRSVYKNDEDIDFFPAGNSERPVTGGIVGPTFACILAYGFRDLRRGDRNWYENGGTFRTLTRDQLRSIKKVTLARMICDTSTTTRIQPYAMLLASVPDNGMVNCTEIPELDLSPWQVDAPFGEKSHNDIHYTAWLPVRSAPCEKELPLAPAVSVLRHASVYRPDAVCKEVLGHEMAKVNGHYRVRFACPAGSVMETDYPTVDADYEYWTPWINRDRPTKRSHWNDVEPLTGSGACLKPIAIQAQTTDGIPCQESGDIFEALSPVHGLACYGFQQENGKCKNYRVRFLCSRDNLR